MYNLDEALTGVALREQLAPGQRERLVTLSYEAIKTLEASRPNFDLRYQGLLERSLNVLKSFDARLQDIRIVEHTRGVRTVAGAYVVKDRQFAVSLKRLVLSRYDELDLRREFDDTAPRTWLARALRWPRYGRSGVETYQLERWSGVFVQHAKCD